MKLRYASLEITTRDCVGVSELGAPSVDISDVTILFPDRTPRDKLQAIADAINAALAAARKIEGAGRD